MIVTVTPNPSVDRTYRLGALQPGTLNRARSVTVEASGKGVNVSRVLARLGTRTRMVVAAGGPEGRLLASLLNGLPAHLVEVAGHTRVNITLVAGTAEPTKVNEPGTALSADESTALVSAVESAIAVESAMAVGSAIAGGVTWLACCGSLPAGTDPGLIGQLVAAARAARIPIAVDSSGAALAAAVAARADLVKPNADELIEVVGADLAPHDAARAIQMRTGGTVLASLGAAGALLVTPDGTWHATPPPITPVNTTGAGDALLAGYLSASALAPPDRLTYAVSVGTSACLVESTAALPDPLLPASSVDVRALTSLGA
jgi:1-phosphofructokinase